ncbi:hypothetical protein [Paracoccus sp. (in: a-proteobacteria)]|uniref:hypothetical protein n=1 Tax=Paracoccus sp. TaxID=267 RepID=UPI002AFF3EA4|nr:hypothetical protein [Paracoccus sp. (in: a-proteobacteria)]
MPFIDDVNRLLRDHEGYTGDGQGGVGPLPVGDRSTARRAVWKRDLRDLFITLAQTMGDPGALDEILDQLDDKADIANSGKVFTSRAAAVNAGQEELPNALGMIATHEGNYIVYRAAGATADDPLFETAPRWGVAMRVPNDALLAGKADLARTSKSFFSRASAVSFGQENLPSALGLITTREGDWVAYRGPAQFADDPLFAPDDPEAPTNGPWWGVMDRVPVQELFSYALSALGVTPLGNIGGTGNHITAQIVTAGQRAQVGFSIASTFALIPPATNIDEGGAFITIDGDVEREILDEDGNRLTPGYIAPWRTHYLQRRGDSFRVILGPFSRADFEAVLPQVAGDGTITPLITSSGRALLWLYDGLLDAAGLSPALREDAVREIAPRVDSSGGFVPLTKSGQRLITWLDETGFNYVGRDEQPEPDTVLARTVTDGRSLNSVEHLDCAGCDGGARSQGATCDAGGQLYSDPLDSARVQNPTGCRAWQRRRGLAASITGRLAQRCHLCGVGLDAGRRIGQQHVSLQSGA